MNRLFFILLTVALGIFIAYLVFISLVPFHGALQITSVPTSKIYLNGKFVGTTPFCACKSPNILQAGTYNLKLMPQEADLKPFQSKITINPGDVTVVDSTFEKGFSSEGSIITLYPLSDKHSSEIVVSSLPFPALVLLDNKPEGNTPLVIKNLSYGVHELEVSRNGYQTNLIKLLSMPGYELNVIAYLGIDSNLPGGSVFSFTNKISQITILNTPTGFLRVRSGPSLDSSQTGEVLPGQKFTFTAEQNGWIEIKLSNGNLGWISSQYTSE